jgi:hypothetical protein
MINEWQEWINKIPYYRTTTPAIKNNSDPKTYKYNKKTIKRLLRNSINNHIYYALKKKPKPLSNEELLGCSIEELKIYIESKFSTKMTWENYGKNGWHIDHIKPKASFNLNYVDEQRKCFHYSNLQPLWGAANRQKNSIYFGKRYLYSESEKRLQLELEF